MRITVCLKHSSRRFENRSTKTVAKYPKFAKESRSFCCFIRPFEIELKVGIVLETDAQQFRVGDRQVELTDGEVPDSEAIVQNGAVAVGSDVEGSGSTGGGMMGHGGGGMMGGSRGGWGGIPFVGGALGMLGVVGGLLYWALGRGDAPPKSDDSAMETLQRRYARGEIDETEFQQRRERLADDREVSSR